MTSSYLIRGLFLMSLFLLGPASLYFGCRWLGRLLGLFFPKAPALGRKAGLVLSISLALCFLFGFTIGWRILRVREVTLQVDDLPAAFDGYRIAHLSDWHLGSVSGHPAIVKRAVSKVLEARPDVILFTGDLENRLPSEVEQFQSVLSRLSAPDGVWSVLGNHDYGTYQSDLRVQTLDSLVLRLKELEMQMGWKLLQNEHGLVARGRDTLAILGVENQGEPPFPQLADLPKAMAGLPAGCFKILLTHDPSHWRNAVLPDTDIQLTLSGHTHAWQFRVGPLSPAMLFFKEWAGEFREGRQVLFVSSGLGGWVNFRFGAWPEIDILTLRGK